MNQQTKHYLYKNHSSQHENIVKLYQQKSLYQQQKHELKQSNF